MDVACAIDTLEEETYFSYENDPIQAGEILPKKQSVLKKIKGFISHSYKTKRYSESRGKGDALATISQDEAQLGCSDMDVTMKEPQDDNLLPMNNSLQENNGSSNITNASERETDLSTQPEVCPGQIFKKKRSFWKRIKGKRSHSKVIKQGESEDTSATTGDTESQPGCSDMDVTVKEPQDNNLLPMNNSLQENNVSSNITNASERDTDLSATTGDTEPQLGCSDMDVTVKEPQDDNLLPMNNSLQENNVSSNIPNASERDTDLSATTGDIESQPGCFDMDVTVKEPQDDNLLPMNNSLQENNGSSNITDASERETDLSTQPEVCPGQIFKKKHSFWKRLKGKRSYSKVIKQGESEDTSVTTDDIEPQPGCSDMDVTVKEPQDNNLLPMNNSLQEINVSPNITNASKRETDLSTQPEVCPGQIFKKKRSFWKRIKGKRSHSKVIKQGESEDTSATTGDIEQQPGCSHKNDDRWAARRKYTTSETFSSNGICTKQESDDKSLSPTDEPRSYSWYMSTSDEVLSINSFYSCHLNDDSYSKVVTNGAENDPKSKGDSDREDIQNKQSESDDEQTPGCSWMNLDGWADGPKTKSEDIYTENVFLKAENEFLKKQVKDLKEFIEIEGKRNAVLQAEIKALKEQALLKNLDTKEARENDLFLMTLQENENSSERENDLPTQEGKILPHKTWTHGPKSKFKSKNGSGRKGIKKNKGDADKKLATSEDDCWSVKDVTVEEPQDNNLLPMNNSLQEGPEVCPGQILEKKRSVLKKIKGFFTHGFKKKSKSTKESHTKSLNIVGWTAYRILGIEVYLPD